MDNHQYQIPPHSQECLLGIGEKERLEWNGQNAMEELERFTSKKGRWLFGHLAYDLKNDLESGLDSRHPDGIGFAGLSFFEPAILIRLNPGRLIIEAENPEQIYAEIEATEIRTTASGLAGSEEIRQRLTREEYLSVIHRLQEHILRGDCYEINFCQEFYIEPATINPLQVFHKLSDISPNPFSAFYRQDDKWLICASPERFIKKEGNRILSQPIKGTARRIKNDLAGDEKIKQDLFINPKDRSENVMIVDLVRNDLSKVCKEGSVEVEELYGIYSFPQVHQMISTISGELKEDLSFADIIKATFPMGSMTGAPKKRVMQLIEQYEKTKRGVFSGAIGYLSPDGNFDFNVVIRSILYNASRHYLSFQAGSAITFYSDPEKEWEECLLKTAAIRQALQLD